MSVPLPRLLDGQLVVRAFSLEMVLAEKIVTAIARAQRTLVGEILLISTP
jgi:hypothetical protein